MKPSNVVVGYQRFGGPCWLHLQFEVFWFATQRNTVVVHERFKCPCRLHLQGENIEDLGLNFSLFSLLKAILKHKT
jgi:hypothetical protein